MARSDLNWDACAADYARHRPGPPDSYYDIVGRLIGGFSGQRVVDLGTGPGLVAIKLAERGAHVSGYDTSPRQIEQARLRAQGMHNPPTFITGAAEDLLIDGPELDLAIANMSWWYFDAKRILDLLSIRMKPQGSLVISAFTECPDDPATAIAESVLRDFGGEHQRPDTFSPAPWHGRLSAHHPFRQHAAISYIETMPFNATSWVGRWLASKMVLRSLSAEAKPAFASTLKQKILHHCGDAFHVKYRIAIEIYRLSLKQI